MNAMMTTWTLALLVGAMVGSIPAGAVGAEPPRTLPRTRQAPATRPLGVPQPQRHECWGVVPGIATPGQPAAKPTQVQRPRTSTQKAPAWQNPLSPKNDATSSEKGAWVTRTVRVRAGGLGSFTAKTGIDVVRVNGNYQVSFDGWIAEVSNAGDTGKPVYCGINVLNDVVQPGGKTYLHHPVYRSKGDTRAPEFDVMIKYWDPSASAKEVYRQQGN